MNKNCENCGREFFVHKGNFEKRRFCCKPCWRSYQKKNDMPQELEGKRIVGDFPLPKTKDPSKWERNICDCGKGMWVKKKLLEYYKRVYCSKSCKTKYCEMPSTKGIRKTEAEKDKVKQSVLKKFRDDPDYRRRISESTKEGMSNPEVRERYLKAFYEKALPKIKEAQKNPSYLKKLSASIKEALHRPEIRKRHLEGIDRQMKNLARNRVLPTGPETKLKEFLIQFGFEEGKDFVYNKRMKLDEGRSCYPDFLFESRKLVVEVDGEYWHEFEKNQIRDVRRNKLMSALGYRILRFPSKEILSGNYEHKLLSALS